MMGAGFLVFSQSQNSTTEAFEMKNAIAATLVTFTLLLAAPVLAQEAKAQESSRADFDDFCKAMEGRWVGDVVWIADWPGLGKKGDRVTCYCEMTITEDGNALIGKFFGGGGSGTWLTVYDAGKKQIRETSSNSGGTVFTYVYAKAKDGNLKCRMSGSNPNGDKLKGQFLVTVSDNGNTHSWSGSSTTAGKPNDDLQDVWKRVSSKHQAK